MTTMMTGGRRGKIDDGEERGRRGKKKIDGTDRVIVCTDCESWGSSFNARPVRQVVLLILGVDFNTRPVRQVVLLFFRTNMFERLDGPNTRVGMVSPPFSATNDNSHCTRTWRRIGTKWIIDKQ